MLIDRNAGLIEPEVIGIGTTSYCEQEMGPANLGTAASAIKGRRQFFPLFPYGQALCVKAHVDAFALKYLSYCGRDIFIFAMNQTRPHFDDCDFTAKTAIHLSKLKAYVAAAYNQQMPRKKIDVHHRAIGEVFDLIKPGHSRRLGTPPNINEYVLRR
jgi:hypothetical protein